jgi:hypothetical protein
LADALIEPGECGKARFDRARRLAQRVDLLHELHQRARRHAFRHGIVGAGENARQRGGKPVTVPAA